MIRLLVLYPRSEGTTFDADYWVNTHMPLAARHFSTLAKWEADLADDGPWYAAAHLYFESPEDLAASLSGPGAAAVADDRTNYTDVVPQTSVHRVAATS
jgi:uncharacterized protein (TIGR02118 family)